MATTKYHTKTELKENGWTDAMINHLSFGSKTS